MTYQYENILSVRDRLPGLQPVAQASWAMD